ncbi:MAG: hypothetical protein AVDCRST_MAG12-1566 [uncultured Rubrobacteraceae bacterium]|uniref:Methyltransferase domain-containing protein n=1 Tax=uncultured Rubrobacteraceae bacterium TaxID=349277 RepID=A0A6J4S0E1_9ACTN|nr:MAG: hypothetical protein AVDCRST_MAG12-1566 [uncultured Rubrobacteraceae bacterium]
MASVQEHYERLLAQHYTWMRGGFDLKVREYGRVLEDLGVSTGRGGKALDLGAGSGFQTAALAGLGFRVVSLDSSEALLRELRERTPGREVRTVLGDMRDAGAYAAEAPFAAAVCMGDTLTHLGSLDEVSALIGHVHDVLEEGGKLVLEFRDYAAELEGVDRAIPVRLDEDRIMITFLEYEALHVNVHDVMFLKQAGDWTTQKSAYKKLRVGTEEVIESLVRAGFRLVEAREERGFSVVVGQA